MLKPYDTVNQLRVEIRMCCEDITPKHKIQTTNDTKTTLKHMCNTPHRLYTTERLINKQSTLKVLKTVMRTYDMRTSITTSPVGLKD